MVWQPQGYRPAIYFKTQTRGEKISEPGDRGKGGPQACGWGQERGGHSFWRLLSVFSLGWGLRQKKYVGRRVWLGCGLMDGWMVSGSGQLARFWGGKAGPSFLEGDTAEGVEQGLGRALATTQHHH